MVRVLVLYGTSEGHTGKIAHVVANTLMEENCEADVVRAGTIDPDVSGYDGVIVAASVHGGTLQKAVRRSVRAHAAEIAARPNALVAVCLSVMNKDNPKVAAGLEQMVSRFAGASGWKPVITKFVAGALPYTRSNFFTRWIMKRIVAGQGGDTDTTRDYVYTDWEDVKRFAHEFGRRVAERTDARRPVLAG